MRQFEELRDRNAADSLRSTLLLLLFGLGTLAFLVAADHPQWFLVRPASASSFALSKAVAPEPGAPPSAPHTAPAP